MNWLQTLQKKTWKNTTICVGIRNLEKKISEPIQNPEPNGQGQKISEPIQNPFRTHSEPNPKDNQNPFRTHLEPIRRSQNPSRTHLEPIQNPLTDVRKQKNEEKQNSTDIVASEHVFPGIICFCREKIKNHSNARRKTHPANSSLKVSKAKTQTLITRHGSTRPPPRRTSFSPNTMNYPARGSKSATLLSPSLLFSSFFLLSLGVLWGWEKTINCVFSFFLLFPLPATAENDSYCQNNHICGHSPDENNFA